MRRLRTLLNQQRYDTAPLLRSQLYSEGTFYATFERDIRRARQSVIVESPFITWRRFNMLHPMLVNAVNRDVRVTVNTRDPEQHEGLLREQAAKAVEALHFLDITVLYTGNLHRKLAIIDGEVLWEGSLNILSQNDSCELMRRTESRELVEQMVLFTGLTEWYT